MLEVQKFKQDAIKSSFVYLEKRLEDLLDICWTSRFICDLRNFEHHEYRGLGWFVNSKLPNMAQESMQL